MQKLCWSITSNNGNDRLTNASTDENGDSHICTDCDRPFRTNRAHNNKYLRSCSLKNRIIDVQIPYERREDDANDQIPED